MQLGFFPDRQRFKDMARRFNVIPVCIEVLADTETPVSLMKKFYDDRRPFFLLESVEGGERWGRYSFLGTSCRTHVCVYRDVVEMRTNGRVDSREHGGRPLDVLREFMAPWKAPVLPELPRFWGGLVGYFTYEMVSFIEKIPHLLPPETPMAHFILPEDLIIFDNIRNTLLALSIAFIDEPADDARIEDAYETALGRLAAIMEVMNTPLPAGNDNPPTGEARLHPVVDEETFRHNVRIAKDHIRAGDIIQTVLSQPFVCDAAPDPWMLYRAQRYINPSPYMYFIHLGDATLVGSSPETMVRLENGIATLRPIAGTRRRGKDEQEDRELADELLRDEKERAEHLMLVDLGRNDLGRVAETGTVQVTDLMFVERYSHVMHLVSNIQCDLTPGVDAWDLLAAAFPAGTLSGAPKVRAMEIIAELEKRPRGTYGGAAGYVSFSGNMDMAITIRTACIEGDRLTVQAGAGIVADSDPEKERVETVNKAMAIEKALQLIHSAGTGRNPK